MNRKYIAEELRQYSYSPVPEGKMQFFRRLEETGLLDRRPHVISHREFLAIQFRYIEKCTWGLSGVLLLFIFRICTRNSGNYPFALTPLLAAGILFETGRSGRRNMAELEQAARFSVRSVILSRAFLLGAVNTAGLMIVILAVRPFFSYSLTRVFLYMMVPYLTASLLGSLYERKYRNDKGWGSVAICILSSAIFASVPLLFSQLYEERLILIWAAALAAVTCGLAVLLCKNVSERREPAWN